MGNREALRAKRRFIEAREVEPGLYRFSFGDVRSSYSGLKVTYNQKDHYIRAEAPNLIFIQGTTLVFTL